MATSVHLTTMVLSRAYNVTLFMRISGYFLLFMHVPQEVKNSTYIDSKSVSTTKAVYLCLFVAPNLTISVDRL
ncbi:hypothetical protein GCM10027341_04260 [Spirosoma knui]